MKYQVIKKNSFLVKRKDQTMSIITLVNCIFTHPALSTFFLCEINTMHALLSTTEDDSFTRLIVIINHAFANVYSKSL